MLKLPNKYRKTHSRKMIKPKESFNLVAQNGCFGLVSTEVGFLTLKQLGAIRKYAKYLIKKQTKLWIKASAQFTITKKPNESRMGKGKASLKYWVSYQKKNRYLIEFKGLSNNSSITALAKKLSLKVLPKAKVY